MVCRSKPLQAVRGLLRVRHDAKAMALFNNGVGELVGTWARQHSWTDGYSQRYIIRQAFSLACSGKVHLLEKRPSQAGACGID